MKQNTSIICIGIGIAIDDGIGKLSVGSSNSAHTMHRI